LLLFAAVADQSEFPPPPTFEYDHLIPLREEKDEKKRINPGSDSLEEPT
jgi:hypothetical protein